MPSFDSSLDRLLHKYQLDRSKFLFENDSQRDKYKNNLKDLYEQYAADPDTQRKIETEVEKFLQTGYYTRLHFRNTFKSLDDLLTPEKEEEIGSTKYFRLGNLLIQTALWESFKQAYKYLAKDKTPDTKENERLVRNQLAALINGEKETCIDVGDGNFTEFYKSTLFPDRRQRIRWDRTMVTIDKDNSAITNPAEALFHEGVHAIEAQNNEAIQKLRQITPHREYQTHEEYAAIFLQNKILKAKDRPQRKTYQAWRLSAPVLTEVISPTDSTLGSSINSPSSMSADSAARFSDITATEAALSITLSNASSKLVKQHDIEGQLSSDKNGEFFLTDKTGQKIKYDTHQLYAVVEMSMRGHNEAAQDLLKDAILHKDVIKISLSPGQMPKYENPVQQLRLTQYPMAHPIPRSDGFITRNFQSLSGLASKIIRGRQMEGEIIDSGKPGEIVIGEIVSADRIKNANPNYAYIKHEASTNVPQFYRVNPLVLSNSAIGERVTLEYPPFAPTEIVKPEKMVDAQLKRMIEYGSLLEDCHQLIAEQITQYPDVLTRKVMADYLPKAIKYAANAKSAIDCRLNQLIARRKSLENCLAIIKTEIDGRAHSATSEIMRAYLPQAIALATSAEQRGFTHGYKHIELSLCEEFKGVGLNAWQIAITTDNGGQNQMRVYTLKLGQTVRGMTPQFGQSIEGVLTSSVEMSEDKTKNAVLDKPQKNTKKRK